MRYDLTTPCPECPFLTGKTAGDKPVRLTYGRVKDIDRVMGTNPGGEFPCHKTAIGKPERQHQHCAGALIYMMRTNREWTQIARVVARLGLWNPEKMTGQSRVFASAKAFFASALPSRRPKLIEPSTKSAPACPIEP